MRLPGPRGPALTRVLEAFQRSPLPTLEQLVRDYGDVVVAELPTGPMFVLAHPSAIEHVLIRHADNFLKSQGSSAGRRLFGGALQMSNGERVKQMRRMLAPALSFDRLAANHTRLILEQTETVLDTWAPGVMPDLTQSVMDMLAPIFVRMYFGTEGVATGQLAQLYAEAIALLPDSVSGFVPDDQGRRFDEAVYRLDAAIGEVLQARVRNDRGETDFAAQYLRQGLTPGEVRDELVTMMAASYRTVGMALVQALRLAAEHPAADAAVAAEALAAPRDHLDPRALPYTGMLLKESLRLCPPAGLLTRIAVAADVIDGWPIPAGASVFLSPWVTQRDARFFPDPLTFRPERWTRDAERQAGCAYFPFGVGGRSCIGSVMSDVMLRLIVATIARRYRLEVASAGRTRDAWPLLMADGGPRATLHARTAAGAG